MQGIDKCPFDFFVGWKVDRSVVFVDEVGNMEARGEIEVEAAAFFLITQGTVD